MHDSDSANAIAAFVGSGFFLFIVIFCLAIVAFAVWLQWRIMERTGMSGALSLLILVPFGALVVQLMLAFGRWPIEDRLMAAEAGHPYIPNPYGGPPAAM